ncbi:MAG: cation:proton antiporter [Proteobacteria bacterium]|nr:cation:proton antiporter [Pseudomonadota bacterium]
MSTAFFVALGACLLPPLLLRSLRLPTWLPLVFVQLLLGIALGNDRVDQQLRLHGIDLAQGALADALRGIGTLGLCLLVGLSAGDAAAHLHGRQRWRCVPISIGGFALAVLGGAALGALLVVHQPALMGPQAMGPQVMGPRADGLRFVLAIGVAMAVTALPVLLAQMAQLGIAASPLGRLAAGAAALDELWLWLALGALLLPAADGLWRPLAGLLALLAALAWVVRPGLAAFLRRHAEVSAGERMALGVAVIALSSAATQALGLHAALGAFWAGALLPRALLEAWREPMLAVAQHLLLPFFFVITGTAIQIDAGNGAFWLLAAAVSAAGIGLKFAASSLAVRATGLPWRDACAVGSLLQCKGLMELVAVGLLLQHGLLAPPLAGALAIMTLCSTLATPLLWQWTRSRRLSSSGLVTASAARAARPGRAVEPA